MLCVALFAAAPAAGGVGVSLAGPGEMGATCDNIITGYSASAAVAGGIVAAPPEFALRTTLRMVEALPPSACGALTLPAMLPGERFALIALRGNCTFSRKMAMARSAGADVLVVANTLGAMYAPTNTSDGGAADAAQTLLNPCVVDCARARRFAPHANASGGLDCASPAGTCASDLCASTGQHTAAGFEYCCYLDAPTLGTVESAASPSATPLVLFVGVVDGATLLRDARAQRSRVVFRAGSNAATINPSSYLIWVLGVFTVVTASLRAAGAERRAMRLRGAYKRVSERASEGQGGAAADAATEREDSDGEGAETVSLTIYHAFGMIMMSALLLLVLFFFITQGECFEFKTTLTVCEQASHNYILTCSPS